MFGPQKGAKPEDISKLDDCAAHLINLTTECMKREGINHLSFDEIVNRDSAGASGGIIAAFMSLYIGQDKL